MSISREFDLIINAGTSSPLVINANQNDSGETWLFNLYQEDGTKVTPLAGQIVGLKTDGHAIINAGTVNASGQVVITETEQITACPGANIFELVFDSVHGTANFILLVEKSPVDDDADLSESDISAINQAIAMAIDSSTVQAIQQGLENETAARIAAVSAEASTRAAADTSEAATRAAADASLREAIDAMVSPSGQSVVVDSSLSISGAAADAKVTGDEISDLNQALTQRSENVNLFDTSTATDGKRFDQYGAETNDENCFVSDFIAVQSNITCEKNSPVEDNYHRFVVYTSSRDIISVQAQNEVTIPSNGVYVRICGLLTEKNTTTVILVSAKDTVARKELNIISDNVVRISTINDNLFDETTAIDNSRIDGNGNVSPGQVGYYTSALIPVVPNCEYSKNSPVQDNYHRFAVYDSTTAFISGELYTSNNITIPENGAYVRICGLLTEKETASVTIVTAKDNIARYKLEKIGNVAQTIGMLGSDGIRATAATLTANSTFQIASFPQYLKKNILVSFVGKFDTFAGLLIGKGYNSYRGDWVRVTDTQVIFHHYEASDAVVKTVDHNLTISDYIMVTLYFDEDGRLNCSVNSKTGTFNTYLETNYNAFSGTPFVISLADMNNIELSVSNGETRKPFWMIGDSYFGVIADRVLGQLKALGFWAGVLADGLAGLDSQSAYAELNRLLQFGKPKYLIWYLGMNDSDNNFLTYMNLVKQYCLDNGITLILNKVPTVPDRDKETTGSYVMQSGCRYIDSYAAVGADSSGNWYTGFLSSDNVHPTELGAKALAMRMLIDVPEIAQYGYKNTSVSGNSSGDH